MNLITRLRLRHAVHQEERSNAFTEERWDDFDFHQGAIEELDYMIEELRK